MFTGWKVPQAVANSDCSVSPRSPRREKFVQPRNSSQKEKMTAAVAAKETPTWAQNGGPVVAPVSPVRTQSPRKEQHNGRLSHSGSGSPRKDENKLPQIGTPPKQGPARMRESDEEVLRQVRHDAVKERADELMKYANSSQRRVIEKAYKASERGELERQVAQKRVKAQDTKRMLNQWLDQATNEEKKAAIEFFGIMKRKNDVEPFLPAGSVKIDQVLKLLDSFNVNGDKFPDVKNDPKRRTKYLRVNTPSKRKDFWMYQTWHHMPPIKDDNKVDNKSSHYQNARPPYSRHFTIHPDWGP